MHADSIIRVPGGTRGIDAARTRYRVLLVVRHPVGGIRTFFRYVYRHFDARLFSFVLLAPDLPETALLLDDLKDLGIDYRPSAPHVDAARFLVQASATLRSGRFDLVHSHGFTSATCVAPAAQFFRVPHILTCHDVFTDAQFSGARGWLRRAVLTATLSSVRRIHCVTNSARDNLLQHLRGLRTFASRIEVIENGIETSRFRQPKVRELRRELGLDRDSFLIGFFGRYMSQKGFRFLVDALDALVSAPVHSRTPVLVSFGGSNGFYREEVARVKHKGLSGHVHFLPFQPDIAASLKGVDVVAMPSLWEACGLLAMEALVSGIPLIGTDCGGLAEVMAGTPATVVPTGDSKALSEAIRKEMLDPSRKSAQAFAATAALRFEVRDRALEIQRMVLEELGERNAVDV